MVMQNLEIFDYLYVYILHFYILHFEATFNLVHINLYGYIEEAYAIHKKTCN
jgi:hypothetical protein